MLKLLPTVISYPNGVSDIRLCNKVIIMVTASCWSYSFSTYSILAPSPSLFSSCRSSCYHYYRVDLSYIFFSSLVRALTFYFRFKLVLWLKAWRSDKVGCRCFDANSFPPSQKFPLLKLLSVSCFFFCCCCCCCCWSIDLLGLVLLHRFSKLSSKLKWNIVGPVVKAVCFTLAIK